MGESCNLTQSSDRRLKEDLTPLMGVLEALESLEPVYYRFRAGTQHSRAKQIGLLAQQVERVFPELVSRDASGYLSLSYSKLSAVLVQAVKEQQAEIEGLRAALEQLRAQHAALEVDQVALREGATGTEARLAALEAALGHMVASPVAPHGTSAASGTNR